MIQTREGNGEKIRVLSSHWNRLKVKNGGTGIFWDHEHNKWIVRVVRELGIFDTLLEAAAVMEHHLKGIEKYFAIEYLDYEARELLAPTQVVLDDSAFEISKAAAINTKKIHEEDES